MMERTLVVIKPDAMKRKLADKIISYYEKEGLKVVAKKEVHLHKDFAERHYQATDEQVVGMGNKTIAASRESGLYEEMIEKFGTDEPKSIGMKLRGWLVDYITSVPVLALVLEGEDAVAKARKITGFTDPKRAEKGTVRGDFGEDSIVDANKEFRPVQNLVHCADAEGAKRELLLWFPELDKSLRIVFFGPPGSGKGTYASRVAPTLGIIHISTGDLFRAEIAAGSELGVRANEFIKKGDLVPDEVTINMLKERISREDCEKGFILDGFPRNVEQANALEKITHIDMIANFVLAEDILIEKALARRVCKNCGNTYNVAEIKHGRIEMPPLLPQKEGICDKCGGPLVQRQDDNESTIKDRIHVYHSQSEPLLKHYKEKKLVVDVDVIGAPDVMVPIVIEAIKKHVHK